MDLKHVRLPIYPVLVMRVTTPGTLGPPRRFGERRFRHCSWGDGVPILHRVENADLASYRIRRERELGALYATARSLTALGELDAVLESIVREAHELVGTDFTYLSLVGP